MHDVNSPLCFECSMQSGRTVPQCRGGRRKGRGFSSTQDGIQGVALPPLYSVPYMVLLPLKQWGETCMCDLEEVSYT